MRPFSTEWRHGTPRPRLGKRSSRSLCGLTLAIAAAATTVGWQPARAAVDDNWAGPMISQMLSERSQEAGAAPAPQRLRPIPTTTASGRSAGRP